MAVDNTSFTRMGRAQRLRMTMKLSLKRWLQSCSWLRHTGALEFGNSSSGARGKASYEVICAW